MQRWRVALVLVLVLASACKRRKPLPIPAVDASIDGSLGSARLATDGPSVATHDAGAVAIGSYISPSGRFRARFPDGKSPDVETITIPGGLTMRLYKVQYGTGGYIVAHDDSAKTSGRSPKQVLDSARESVLETTGGTLDEEKPIELEGFPGRDLVVTATTSGIKMRQRLRVVLVLGRLYQVILVTPSWAGSNQTEQAFFDSFCLTPDASDAGL